MYRDIHALGKARIALIVSSIVAVSTAAVLADRGRGSIRAAGRPVAVAPPRVDVHVDTHVDVRRPPPVVVHEAPKREVAVHHEWDDHDEEAKHFGGFGHGMPARFARGEHVRVLPEHHFNVEFNHHNYFWDDIGIYYELQPDGQYIVVQPPIGVVVAQPPQGLTPIVVGPTTYEYLDGVFYVQQGPGLVVVNPPPGVVVPTVPTGAQQVVVNGTVVYQFNGFNYMPSIQGGVTVYTVTPA